MSSTEQNSEQQGIKVQGKKTLNEAKKWLEILFGEAPDAYFLSDLKGKFLAANKEAERIIGYKREELIGKNMLEINILPKDQIARVMKRIAQHVLGQSVGVEDLDLIRKDGARISIEVSGNMIKLDDGSLLLGIAREVTKRKRMEKELKERNEELEKFKQIATGRELKMMELKDKIKELEERLKSKS